MPDVDWDAPVATMIPARPGARMTFGTEESECSSSAQPREAWFSRISIGIFESIPCFESFSVSFTFVFPREHKEGTSR
jgi:hypothetical protein